MSIQLIFLTSLTMVAFAANSVLCRLALADSGNDPISFTLIRLASGAVALALVYFKYRKQEPFVLNKNVILAPLMLLSYAALFSLSYVQMSAGTGALILFASVQITMIIVAILKKQTLTSREWYGFLLAISGLVYLLLPGLNRPPLTSTIAMIGAGVSWGVYSLVGQKEKNPYFATSRNFLYILPLAILFFVLYPVELTYEGFLLAVASGAITSGMGYLIWYVVLQRLSITTAAIVQLSVPALAAIGGVFFLEETFQLRLIIASLLIFSGIILKLSKSFALQKA